MENRTQESGSIEERLFAMTLKLAPGQYLPVTAPENASFESFRTKIFGLFRGFEYRDEITIKGYPRTRTVHIVRKGQGVLGAVGEPRKEPTRGKNRVYSDQSFTNSGEITDENVKSIAMRKYMDEAGEGAQKVFESLLGLNWQQATEQIGLTVTSIENLEGFFLYCLVQAPWKKERTREEDTTTRQSSLFEQVLELGENDEAEEENTNAKE